MSLPPELIATGASSSKTSLSLSSSSIINQKAAHDVSGTKVIGAGTEFEGTLNATLTGIKKKMVTEWRCFDKIFIIVGVFFINVILATDSSAAATIQPKVLNDFNDMPRAGIIATIIFMFIAGIRPVFAKISYVFGHLHALILAMVLHTLGLISCASAKRFSAIFAGTAVAVLAIILVDILPVHLRAVVTAYVYIPFITNYYLGVEVANSLVDRWHWVYGILAILAIACSMPAFYSLYFLDKRARATLRTMESSTVIEKKPMLKHFSNAIMEMDVPGLVLICGGIIAILAPLGMQLNVTYGWGSPYVIAPLVIGVVALAFFVYYGSHLAMFSVVPFKLFKSHTFFPP
ncbi:hypothetical protein LPJ66_003486 [Kickxella alabastrina]|uniref:Uncharacterized protein n=1 Tax=Kickxella alabastrina TaxID=61397 RepID=A0ACC1INT1_9FUNG|nr:hypothetical protein LPJ66_003486 [Kickxella alabastrina]